MKKILIFFIGLPFICFSQCPDADAKKYSKKFEQYGDTSYEILAKYYYFKCQCENGIGNVTVEQINKMVLIYNNMRDASQNSNGIEIEGQHKVKWVNISKVPPCSSSKSGNDINTISNASKNSSSDLQPLTDATTSLINGEKNEAIVGFTETAVDGLLEGNNTKTVVGATALLATSIFGNEPGSKSRKEVREEIKNEKKRKKNESIARSIEANNAKELNFFQKKLTKLPEYVSNQTKLQWLDLRYNKLTSLPKNFGNLTNLLSIRLDYNKLTSLPENFGNLTNLKWLDLNNNKLTSLPENFGNLTNLKKLNLNYNELTSLPVSFGNLTNLESLDLFSNNLTSLPESFGNLTNLKSLKFDTYKLTSFPEIISNLNNLQQINLYGFNITSLPESFGNLTKLHSLHLGSNPLTSFPESFSNLINLDRIKFTRDNKNKKKLKKILTKKGYKCRKEDKYDILCRKN